MAIDDAEDLINVTISFVDNVDPGTAEAVKRLRYLQFAQEKVNDLYLHYEWLWIWSEADVVPNTDGRFTLPARFFDVGRHGALVEKATGKPFQHVPLKEMREDRFSPLGSGRDTKFSIGMSELAIETRYGWVPRGWSGTTLTLSYRRTSPTLIDLAASPELLEIPRMYREGWLVYAMRAMAYDDKGDERAGKWEARAEMALNAGTSGESPQKDDVVVMGGSGYVDESNC